MYIFFHIFNHSLFLHEAHYNFAYSICLTYDRMIAQDSVALLNLWVPQYIYMIEYGGLGCLNPPLKTLVVDCKEHSTGSWPDLQASPGAHEIRLCSSSEGSRNQPAGHSRSSSWWSGPGSPTFGFERCVEYISCISSIPKESKRPRSGGSKRKMYYNHTCWWCCYLMLSMM